ncbi:MAG: hypothetical protein WCQ53_05445 [bacterium]
MKKYFLLTTLLFFCSSLSAQFYSIEAVKSYYDQQAKNFMRSHGIEETADDKETLLEQEILITAGDKTCFEEKKDAFDKHEFFMSWGASTVDKINDITAFLKRKGYLTKYDSKRAFLESATIACTEGIYNCITSTVDFQYLAKKEKLDAYVITFNGHMSNLVKDPVSNRYYIVDYYYGSEFGEDPIVLDGLKKAKYFLSIPLNPLYVFEHISTQDNYYRSFIDPSKRDKALTELFGTILFSKEFKTLQAQYSVEYEKLASAVVAEMALQDEMQANGDKAETLLANTLAAAKKGKEAYQAALDAQKKLVDDIKALSVKIDAAKAKRKLVQKGLKDIEAKVHEMIKTLSPELL